MHMQKRRALLEVPRIGPDLQAVMPDLLLDARGARSRDLKEQEFKWDSPVVHEFSDTHPTLPGHKVLWVNTPEDLHTLGGTLGHCAGAQWQWATEAMVYYFFTIVSPNGQPHVTVHCKHLKWLNKAHPLDSAIRPWLNADKAQIYCPKCQGGGYHYPNGPQGGYEMCPDCGGRGMVANPQYGKGHKKGELPIPVPKDGIRGYGGCYPKAAVLKAFEDAGVEYEPAKYALWYNNSCSYDIDPRRAGEYESGNTWDRHFAQIREKPAHVTDEMWATYTKNWKSMKDAYDKGVGNVKMVGRTFKFDRKELIVMLFSAKGDYSGSGVGTKYKAGFHEYLIALNKRKKESDGK